MIFSRPSQGIIDLCQYIIDNPHDWRQGYYEFICMSNPDLKIWTSNGTKYIKINGNDCLNYAEKKLIVRSINKSMANRFIGIGHHNLEEHEK